jgi:serine/threonine protein kinase
MIGEKLGKYTILETLGTGNMGTVYKAEDPDGRIVALKRVRSQVLYDVERRERFLQGILAASFVHHEGVCPILEIGDDNDDFFVVMPYLDGKTLEQHLEHKPLPWQDAVDITLAAAQALVAVHAAGAVHRGLKPSNIWLMKQGTVVVSDCAIARFTEIGRRSRTRSPGPGVDFADTLIPLAALAYMSPEQVRGDSIDARTDIFSLGAILYEMLTGRHPFDARNSLSRMSAILEAEPPPLTSKLASIPKDLDRVVHKALAKEPSDRYGNMHDFLTQLKVIQQGTAEEPKPLQERRKLRSFRTLGWLTVITLVFALIAVLLFRLFHL